MKTNNSNAETQRAQSQPNSLTPFSPGDWRVLDCAIVSDQINEYGNFIIADCRREPAVPEDIRNLRLMAASKELFAALDQVEFHCPQGELKPDDRYPVSLLGAQIQAIRSAIAKARGEKS